MPAMLILVEASPRRAADGVVETVRMAGGGAQLPYFYGGNHWRAGIVQLPTFVTAINFEGGDFGEGGVPQATELLWAASSKDDLSRLAGYFWIDAAITIRIGEENAAGTLPPIALAGKVLSALVDGGTLKIQLSDPAADLKKPLLTDRYGGTGGLDGPIDWKGKIKDRVWGRVWNKAGEPIDKANNIYAFTDPLRPIQSFDLVRDKGAPAASLVVLGWQGTAAATFAALQSSVAPAGGGVICPALSCVKWWTQPEGELTADLRGEVGSGYVETTAEIVQRIVAAGPATPFAANTVAAAAVARPAAVGWVAKDDATTVAAMIEDLLGNSSLLWEMNASGEIVLRQWAWTAPVAAATSHAVKRIQLFRPVATRAIGYQRNETPMARGDLAGVVFGADLVFSNGASGEAPILNTNVSIRPDGVLAGGGGGAVTFDGLGGGTVGRQSVIAFGGTLLLESGQTPIVIPTTLNRRHIRSVGYLLSGNLVPLFDFTNGTLPAGVAFSRSSAATRFNQAGVAEVVAANLPRFDFNPATGALRGLLVEAARTNIAVRSQEIGTSPWGLDPNTSVTANAAAGVGGANTADKITPANTGAAIRRATLGSMPTGVPLTISFDAKAATLTTVSAFMTQSGFNGAIWTLTGAGAVTAVTGTGNSARIEALRDGWYRCTITQANNGFATVGISPGAGAYTNIVGNGVDGVFVDRVQIEQALTETSFIPTTNASIGRAADLVVLDCSGRLADGTYSIVYTFDDGSTQTVITVLSGTGPVATRAAFRTADGIAAGFVNQRWAATNGDQSIVDNRLISIAANGALSGAGGGGVTYAGIGGGALGLLSSINFDNSLFLESVGGPVATRAAFRTADGIAAGFVNQRWAATNGDQSIVDNRLISIAANGALSGAGGGGVTYAGIGGGLVGQLGSIFFGHSLFLESSGGPVATRGAFRTADGIAAGFVNQRWAATNGDQSIVDNRLVPTGVNGFINSAMTTTAAGWDFAGGTNASGCTISGGRNLGGYSGNRNAAWVRTLKNSGTLSSSEYMFGPVSRGFNGNVADLNRYALPVKQGDRVYVSGRFAIHGGVNIRVRVRLWSSTGTLVTEFDGYTAVTDARSGGPNGTNGEGYAFAECFAAVPSGCAYATWGCYTFASGGQVDMYIFAADPVVSVIPSGQVTGLPYVPGPPDRAADVTIENTASTITGQRWAATNGDQSIVDNRLISIAANGALSGGGGGGVTFEGLGGGALGRQNVVDLSNQAGGFLQDGRRSSPGAQFGITSIRGSVAVTDSVSGGACFIEISAIPTYADWGATINYPSATLGPVAFATKYHIWRNVDGPESTGSSYGFSASPLDALGASKVLVGMIITRASAGAAAATGGGAPSGGGGGLDGGGSLFFDAPTLTP